MMTLRNLQNIHVYPAILWIWTVGAIEFIWLSMLLFFFYVPPPPQSWNGRSTTSSQLWLLVISLSLLRPPPHVPSSIYTNSSGKCPPPPSSHSLARGGGSFPNAAYSLCVQGFSSVLSGFWVEVVFLLTNLGKRLSYCLHTHGIFSLSQICFTGRWTNWLLHFTNEMTFTLLWFRLRGYFSKFLSSMYVFQNKWEFRFEKNRNIYLSLF